MQLLGQNWSQRFKLFHPQVEFQRGAEGTNAGLEAVSPRCKHDRRCQPKRDRTRKLPN